MVSCRICPGRIDGRTSVREMMFGTRQRFDYAHCAACGCWQIVEEPADMAAHYPPGYITRCAAGPPVPGWRRWLRARRARFELRAVGWVGRLLAHWRGPLAFGQQWMQGFGLDLDSRILEVGCGDGARLLSLRDLGFRHLTGQDAFTLALLRGHAGVQWTGQPLDHLTGPFDWIEAHHAFEHFPRQAWCLEQFHRLLRPGGGLLLRVPLCDSDAAERFGADWAQWDAPRHFYLHTRRSLADLAQRCGFTLRQVHDDGTAFGFWGSWLYRQDIPLNDPRVRFDGRPELCQPELWAQFQQDAQQANLAGRADQAAFVFVRH
jgi:SAM-dependent methyltransferase